jgi:hypothetical protein
MADVLQGITSLRNLFCPVRTSLLHCSRSLAYMSYYAVKVACKTMCLLVNDGHAAMTSGMSFGQAYMTTIGLGHAFKSSATHIVALSLLASCDIPQVEGGSPLDFLQPHLAGLSTLTLDLWQEPKDFQVAKC